MKIKYILVLIILISNAKDINSQKVQGTINYITYKKNINSVEQENKTSKSFKLFDNEIKKEIKKLRLILNFSEKKSSFTCIEPLHINSEEKRKFFVAKILQEVYSNFYTQGEYSIIEKDLGGELFLIKKKINLDDWELINETQKIQNYTCYKAIRFFDFMHRGIKKTRKQIVWYSIDLPIYYGPKDFVGFPGLVLKVEDGNLIYEANKIILNPKEIVKIKEPSKKGKEISQKEYDKILEKSSITIRREINKRKKTEQ